jgi:hypothetical protein
VINVVKRADSIAVQNQRRELHREGTEGSDRGDVIEVWHDGRRYNHGKVLQTVPSMGMFWILDAGSI